MDPPEPRTTVTASCAESCAKTVTTVPPGVLKIQLRLFRLSVQLVQFSCCPLFASERCTSRNWSVYEPPVSSVSNEEIPLLLARRLRSSVSPPPWRTSAPLTDVPSP